MANWRKAVCREDGAIRGPGSSSSDEEENGPGEPTNPRQTVPGVQAIDNRMSAPCSAGPGTNGRRSVPLNRVGNARHSNPTGGGRGRGRGHGIPTEGGRGRERGHGQTWAEAPDGRTHLVPRSVHNSPPQLVTQQCMPGITNTRNMRADGPVARRVGAGMHAASLPRPHCGNCA